MKTNPSTTDIEKRLAIAMWGTKLPTNEKGIVDPDASKIAKILAPFVFKEKQSLIKEIREKLPKKKKITSTKLNPFGADFNKEIYNYCLDEVLSILEEYE